MSEPTTTTPAADDAATRAALDRVQRALDATGPWQAFEASRFCDDVDMRDLRDIVALARRALALPLAECEAWATKVRATEQAKEAHVAVMRERLALPRSQWDSIWNREAEALGRIRLAEHFDEKRAHDALRAAVVATGVRATDGEAPDA